MSDCECYGFGFKLFRTILYSFPCSGRAQSRRCVLPVNSLKIVHKLENGLFIPCTEKLKKKCIYNAYLYIGPCDVTNLLNLRSPLADEGAALRGRHDEAQSDGRARPAAAALIEL